MITLTRRGMGLGLVSYLTCPAPRMTASSTTSRKARILCLHGYHGSARILRGQIAGLAKDLDPIAELVFVDAPSLAAGGYGWWHAVTDERAGPSDDPGVDGPRRHYKGWARTRDAIVRTFDAEGPFDGVFGFSQGAALAGLLAGLRAPDGRPTQERPLVFAFAIMVGGFASIDPELARLYDRRDSYDVPSLHVFGRRDSIVSPDTSQSLAARFATPVLLEHAGGHVIASDRSVAEGVSAFVRMHTGDLAQRAPRPSGASNV
jgi:predicted esterase